MKRILPLAIIIVTALIVCTGCEFKIPGEGVNKLALENMERKYGEKFEYVQPAGNSMTGTRNFIASCSEHGRVLVQVDNFRDEDARVFRDNHVAKVYEEKTRNFIKEIADKEFNDTKVIYGAVSLALSADLPADATFEQFLSDPELNIWAKIIVKQSDYSDDRQLKTVLESIFKASGGDGFQVHIYVVDLDDLDSYDDEMHKDIALADKYIKHAYLLRNKDKKKLTIKSRGGVLDEEIEY